MDNFSDEACEKKGKCQKKFVARLLRTIPRTRPLSPAVPASFKNESPDPKPSPLVCTDHHYHMQGRTHKPKTHVEKKQSEKKNGHSRSLDHEWLCVWRGGGGGGWYVLPCADRHHQCPGTPSWPLGPALCSHLNSRQATAGSLSQPCCLPLNLTSPYLTHLLAP